MISESVILSVAKAADETASMLNDDLMGNTSELSCRSLAVCRDAMEDFAKRLRKIIKEEKNGTDD